MTINIPKQLATLALGLGMANAVVAQAPTWSAEQTAVWKVVVQ